MFHAPMGRFQLNQNIELPLFSVFTVLVFFPVGLSLLLHLLPVLLRVKTVETFTPSKNCRRCNTNERPTGKNTRIEWDYGEN